jgi:hypothetical protein
MRQYPKTDIIHEDAVEGNIPKEIENAFEIERSFRKAMVRWKFLAGSRSILA